MTINKTFICIFLIILCSSIDKINSDNSDNSKSEINVQIVNSNSFDSFVSNFGINFNSFMVKLLQEANFENEPFYIKNLAYLFENYNVVAQRTNDVIEILVINTENIITKYFANIDIKFCDNLNSKAKFKITNISIKLKLIKNLVCLDSEICYIQEIFKIMEIINNRIKYIKKNDDDDYVSRYNQIYKLEKIQNIGLLVHNEIIDQYELFMNDPTYDNLIIKINNFFATIDKKFNENKNFINSVVQELNSINKLMCQKILDIDTLQKIDNYLHKKLFE